MSNFWCVDPTANTVEIPLSYGGRDFKIWVLRELSVGEQRDIETAGMSRMSAGRRGRDDDAAGVEVRIDWRRQSFARTLTYIKDWTLTDEKGDKLPISREVVESLRQPVYAVIEEALNGHVEHMKAERGNDQAGVSSPQPMSA